MVFARGEGAFVRESEGLGCGHGHGVCLLGRSRRETPVL